MMQKIMVIGCSGSGKSTLSDRLHHILGIKHIPLDFYFLKPNWEETPKAEWEVIVKRLSEEPAWIMDGNYGGTLNIRLEKADTVIFLDYPTWRCVFRVIKRTLKHYKKVRPGMADGCRERFSWQFLHYVLTYRLTRRQHIITQLEAVKKDKQIYSFTDDRQVNLFLESLL